MQNLFCHVIWHFTRQGIMQGQRSLGSLLQFCLSHPSLVLAEMLSHVWLCASMDCSNPCFPILHHLPVSTELNSCPLSQWCHPTISSSVITFSSCPLSFPASGSFPVSLFFTSGGQSIGTSASVSVLTVTIQSWFPLGLTLNSFLSKGLSRVFSSTRV